MPELVEVIPEKLAEGVLYVSGRFSLAVHLCCCGCGCGSEVVTPLSPAQWQVRLGPDRAVSLWPSVGNWGLPCQSHYWIKHSQIEWAAAASKSEIAAVRKRDRRDLARQIRRANRRRLLDAIGAIAVRLKDAGINAVEQVRRPWW